MSIFQTCYLSVDENRTECVFEDCPYRKNNEWTSDTNYCMIPKGTILKLIGRQLTWEDEPVEYRGDKE